MFARQASSIGPVAGWVASGVLGGAADFTGGVAPIWAAAGNEEKIPARRPSPTVMVRSLETHACNEVEEFMDGPLTRDPDRLWTEGHTPEDIIRLKAGLCQVLSNHSARLRS
jgi:hypothetical protein